MCYIPCTLTYLAAKSLIIIIINAKVGMLKAVNAVIAARQTEPKPTRFGSITQHSNSKVFTIL